MSLLQYMHLKMGERLQTPPVRPEVARILFHVHPVTDKLSRRRYQKLVKLGVTAEEMVETGVPIFVRRR